MDFNLTETDILLIRFPKEYDYELGKNEIIITSDLIGSLYSEV